MQNRRNIQSKQFITKLSIWVVLILCFISTNASFAISAGAMIIDEANLLTPNEEKALLIHATEVATKYNCNIILNYIDDIRSKGYSTADFGVYSNKLYSRLGYTENTSGILFTLSMSDRDWYIRYFGKAHYRFADNDDILLSEDLFSYLSGNNYYAASDELISNIAFSAMSFPQIILFSLGGGFVVSLIFHIVVSLGYKNIRRENLAANYIRQNSFRLTNSRDTYLYENTTRVYSPQKSSSSGGGSSSGRGGKF